MFTRLIKNLFGSRNERLLKQYRKKVNQINALADEYSALTDEQLSAKTAEFRARVEKGESLKDILPEAFATVREASSRTLGMRHFDVQLIGGMVMNDGKIAEMRTGEGKTLMSTLAVYLNTLSGEGVHIITINDYLAKRDGEWMKPVYDLLGLSIGYNLANMDQVAKHEAYSADITYGTNNEFGFDFLRDNMVFSKDQQVQRPLHYAIIDEVDSILIDESRTPLIISGSAEDSSELYAKFNTIIPRLSLSKAKGEPGDYYLDEKSKQAFLTEEGHQHVEKILEKEGLFKSSTNLYDASNILLMHFLNSALRAHTLYSRDVDYIVKDNQVIIVDEHTGRLMEGRRWSEGLHQAVEAKEGVQVQMENQTLATITFQNYFRLYEKLSGMTGTADTEAYEFQSIYGLEVVVIPTNKPMQRLDSPDQIYLTVVDKYQAISKQIKACHEKGQPSLIGTASIEASELLSNHLKKENIKHETLNAKQHEREAHIIAEAGRPGAVTIATNMAGRGTDIVLGGCLDAELARGENLTETQIDEIKVNWKKRHQEVLDAGGLQVIGTERNESRRIDNQLRGRSGRQGDAGASQFYLSMEDNLLRIFSGDRMGNLMRRLGVEGDEAVQHPWISTAIEKAQRRVEGMNFDTRKQLLEYDDVANDQRKVIYTQRRQLLNATDISKTVKELREEAVQKMVEEFVPIGSMEEEWDVKSLEQQIMQDFNLELDIQKWFDEDSELHSENLYEKVLAEVLNQYEEKSSKVEPENMRILEKNVMLQILDTQWKEHLAAMDHLRQSIHLRSYAQKNPAQEYKRECFNLFNEMLQSIKYEFISTLSRVEVNSPEEIAAMEEEQQSHAPKMTYHHQQVNAMEQQPMAEPQQEGEEQEAKPFVRDQPKVGRNDPCPCGSGKKYKQCCGKL